MDIKLQLKVLVNEIRHKLNKPNKKDIIEEDDDGKKYVQ